MLPSAGRMCRAGTGLTLPRAGTGRTVRAVLGALLVIAGILLSGVSAGAGGTDEPDRETPTTSPAPSSPDDGVVSVATVSGLLDPVVVSFVEDQIDEAAERGDVALVLRLNSRGAVVGDDRLDQLFEAVDRSPVPVAVWVGPSGSSALGRAADLAAWADVSGVAPGSRIEVTDRLAVDADLDGRAAVGERVGAELAVDLGLVDNDAAVLGDFILALPGVESRPVGGGIREPVTRVRFSQLGLVDQLFHTVASPAVAYLLLVIGASLVIFELFTAGVGIAAAVGAGCLLLAGYGLAVLPTNTYALVLLALAFVGFAVDVQTGVPRFWSAVGVVALVAGSLTLFRDEQPSWITLLVGVLGTVLAMLGGMPAMVRTRFSTPTIGREWMIGETGHAIADVDPDGTVSVRDAPWRARTNRATPISAGDDIRVVAIDGLVLEVEPADGGATDYRSGRR